MVTDCGIPERVPTVLVLFAKKGGAFLWFYPVEIISEGNLPVTNIGGFSKRKHRSFNVHLPEKFFLTH